MNRLVAIVALGILASLTAMAQTDGASLERALRSLDDISSLITEQEHNIAHLEAQLDNIALQQRCIGDTITRHKWQLAQLRSQYAQVVRNINAHSTALDRLVFIFSARSFGQAWKRATYLRQLSQWREARSHMLSQSIKRLDSQQQALNKLIATRRATLNACNNTRAALQSRLDEATALIVELRSQAPQLVAVLREKKNRAQQLDKSLGDITASHAQSLQSDETASLSLKAASLQCPVAGRHRITGNFGRQHHPTLQYVTTVNNGIDITCYDTPARAVAVENGVVSALYNQDPGTCIVMVRHGDYLSVYAGLTHITVNKGQPVSRNQPLGEVAIDPATHRPLLHFELRQGTTALDPTLYISN